MKITLFTTCKGRAHHLRETLPHNLKILLKHMSVEFLVMDYNSLDGLEAWAKVELAPYIASGRLTYIHEKTAPYHSLSRSKNIILQFATGDIVANVDADNFLADGYIEAVREAMSAGSGKTLVTGPQIVQANPKDGTYGRMAFPLKMFRELRGYEEGFKGWGYDEYDLLLRSRSAGYKQVKLPMETIGWAIQHGDDERYIKNYDPTQDRLLSNVMNRKVASDRPHGSVVNPGWYGAATVYKNFSKEPIRVGIPPHESPSSGEAVKKRGWKAPRMILTTILDYEDRPGVLMAKAWLVRAKKHCPDWDVVIMHSKEIEEIKKFAGMFSGVSFEKMDLSRNEIRKELSGKYGSYAQNYKIPFLRHVHEAEWPPFVFVDADAMICADISALAGALADKPFVATTESKPPWMHGLKIVNTGVFAYQPESGLLDYDRLHAEWIRQNMTIKYPTGEQGLIIPLLERDGYSWEHPDVGPEYNAFGNACVLRGGSIKISDAPPEGTQDWIGWWVGWGCKKDAKIVHAISQYKWWNSAHLHDLWSQLVGEVYAAEKKAGRP